MVLKAGPAVGSAVIFVDQLKKRHNALVTSTHGFQEHPSINLVFVSDDENAHDQYGQQIVHETSIVHQSDQSAFGFYWKGIDESTD